jgi:type IV pilus assembly protein PilN
MIRINLLPTKKKPPKKVIDLQQQLILVVLVLVLLAMGTGYFWMKQSNRIDTLEQEKLVAEAKVRAQDNTLKEVTGVKAARDEVEKKIAVIEKLKKNQAGPVRLLDEISIALPPGVNVITMTESNNNLSLDGEAFTNEEVVRFVDNLKGSKLLSDVMLLETTLGKRDGIDVYKYKLQFVYKGL